jgi:signal transduction histidine kinase
MARVRPTIRLRLTLAYTALVFVIGTALLVVNFFLVRRNLTVEPQVLRQRIELRLGHSLFSFQAPPLSEYRHLEELLQEAASDLRAEALHALMVQSAIAFSALPLISLGLGWFVAGRGLRPLKTITGTAKRLSEETLSERIDLQGPRDELKELADTFDEMLGRLDAAFEAQRRFVANASHELRTPLSIIQAELDVTLSSTEPTLEEFREMAAAIRQAADRSERLIQSLLTISRSEGAEVEGMHISLAPLAAQVAESRRSEAAARSVEIKTLMHPADVRGDEVLLQRLIENLVENAIRYNEPGGWVEIATQNGGDNARILVRNSGAAIPDDEVEALFEPFRRLGADRVRSDRGVGLGLAIVRAVTQAHGGTVEARALKPGGLEIEVTLPAVVPARS